MARPKEPESMYVECKGCNRIFDGTKTGGIQVMRSQMAQHVRETGHELDSPWTFSRPEPIRKRPKKPE